MHSFDILYSVTATSPGTECIFGYSFVRKIQKRRGTKKRCTGGKITGSNQDSSAIARAKVTAQKSQHIEGKNPHQKPGVLCELNVTQFIGGFSENDGSVHLIHMDRTTLGRRDAAENPNLKTPKASNLNHTVTLHHCASIAVTPGASKH